MKRGNLVLAGTIAALASVSAVAGAQRPSAPGAHAAKIAKVQLRHTSLGSILVSSSGFTLYRFTKDPRNVDTCMKIHECPSTWPALKSSGKPQAGTGVKASLLGTISLPGGVKQVTYAGHAMYLYAPSSERAETSYVGASGFGGHWDAVNATGGLVK
jgi:predicted lipoprotein with Yx(FWY)xxD motif